MPSSLKLANNAVGRLASNRSASDTALVLVSGDGAKFPALTTGQYFPVTLVRASDGAVEIVKVTARSSDTLTVTRAQEGTAALALIAGDRVELRLTAGTFTDEVARVEDKADAAQAAADSLAASKVTGPESATNNHIALFDGTTGKLIKGAGKGVPAGEIVGTTDTQTLSNKTLANPSYTGSLTGGTGVVNLGGGQFVKDASGNVGINFSSPDQPLAFADSLGTKIQLNGSNANGYQIGIASSVSGGDAMMKITAGEVGAGEIGFYTTTNLRALIDASGNLRFNSGYGSAAVAYACRAWVNFNSTGGVRASGNVSSVTKNGTGDYTVNFSAGMPDTNYSASISCRRGATNDVLIGSPAGVSTGTAFTTTSARFITFDTGPARVDVETGSVQIFR